MLMYESDFDSSVNSHQCLCNESDFGMSMRMVFYTITIMPHIHPADDDFACKPHQHHVNIPQRDIYIYVRPLFRFI